MSSTNSLARIIGVLDRYLNSYPGGIPKALIKRSTSSLSTQPIICALVVVTDGGDPLSSELTELASSVCTKGLKLSLDVCKIGSARREELKTDNTLKALVARQSARVVIICGGSAAGGSLVEYTDGVSALLTYSLKDVASVIEIKRLFWSDLKMIMRKLAS
jgi:hypothetical protein